MSVEATPEERERFEQITAAWEEYDRTFDPDVIADYLADDIMLMIPDRAPIVGKEAAVEYLDRPAEDADPDTAQWAEYVYVSGDLAVVHAAVATIPDDADDPVDEGIKGLDVYRRDEAGEWKQIITIYNNHL